jgi:hypothetical protein
MWRFVVLFILLLAACGTPETAAPPASAPTAQPAAADTGACGEEPLRAYRTGYNSIIDRWGDAAIKAGQTPAADLKPVIDSMQQIVGELQGLQPPACAQPAHAESVEAMKLSINGYETLLAQKDAGSKIRDSIDLLADARDRVASLPEAPVPTPTALPSPTPLPTLTPVPTSTPTATPLPTATPQPKQGIVTSKTAQVFETSTSTQPIKTLMRDTPVLVFEAAKGRIHVRAGDVEGWISQSSLIIQ